MKIEVANGEVVDKITILRIKESKIKDEGKLKNIKNELHELLPNMKEMGLSENSEHYKKLMDINIKLWNVEDNLRDKERLAEFDEDFTDLARSVYHLNDERSTVKKDINMMTNSYIVEEKSYREYSENSSTR